MFLPSFACCVFACVLSWTVAVAETVCFGQQQLESAEGNSITEALPGTSEDHHPVVKCVAKSDEQNIVNVSILESGSQENIASLNIHTQACVTKVNAKARIECQVQDPIYEIYAEIQNLAVGETRNYTCRKTYFNGRFSHKEEQLSLTAREPDLVSSERVVVILLAVFLAVTLCLLIGSAVGFFVWRHYKQCTRCFGVGAGSPALRQHEPIPISESTGTCRLEQSESLVEDAITRESAQSLAGVRTQTARGVTGVFFYEEP